MERYSQDTSLYTIIKAASTQHSFITFKLGFLLKSLSFKKPKKYNYLLKARQKHEKLTIKNIKEI